MYHILLVDDEWLELDTLEKYIPWEEMGFCVSGTSSNGRTALQMLESLQQQEISEELDTRQMPDVLLTDVKMPVMDGIALSQQVHKRYPHIQIVFLSGYSDFEYVREALSVEACGYILKPLNIDELKRTMEKVKEKCSQINQKAKSQTVLATENMKNLLGFFGERKKDEWDNVCHTCNIYLRLPLDNRYFYIALLTIDEYHFLASYASNGKQILKNIAAGIQNFTETHKILSFHINDCSYLLLSAFPLPEIIEKHLISGNDITRWLTACTYMKEQTPEHFPALYEEMTRFRKWHLKMNGSGHVIICDSFIQKNSAATPIKTIDFSVLIQNLQTGNTSNIQNWLTAYCGECKKKDEGLSRGALELIDKIFTLNILPKTKSSTLFAEKTELYRKLTAAESSTLIEKLLSDFLVKTSEVLSEKENDRHGHLIKQVEDIIRQEYASPLTIEYLAEKVYISPNYLRSLFKEYTGETVLEYMTNVRLFEAANLLKETNLRIHEISQKIGYENPSHFCAVFRKQMGFTPNQYRTNYAKGKEIV